MAEEKRKSFLLYLDYREHLDLLDDAGKGRLLTAIFEYAETGHLSTKLSGMEQMAFSFIRKQMDRDFERYEHTIAARREAGRKGGRPRADGLQAQAKKPFAFFDNQTETKKPDTDTETDTNTDTQRNSPFRSPKGEAGTGKLEWDMVCETEGTQGAENDSEILLAEQFQTFWTEYPKKVGKVAAQRAWNRIKPDPGLFKAIMTALQTVKKSDQWHRERGQYIPNPSTWLNQRRWEDEIPEAPCSSGYPSSLDEEEIDRIFTRGTIGIGSPLQRNAIH